MAFITKPNDNTKIIIIPAYLSNTLNESEIKILNDHAKKINGINIELENHSGDAKIYYSGPDGIIDFINKNNYGDANDIFVNMSILLDENQDEIAEVVNWYFVNGELIVEIYDYNNTEFVNFRDWYNRYNEIAESKKTFTFYKTFETFLKKESAIDAARDADLSNRLLEDELIKLMRDKVVSFSYRKKDGTVVNTMGTTNLGYLEQLGYQPKGTRESSPKVVAYFDVSGRPSGDNSTFGWRSFSVGNLLNIGAFYRPKTVSEGAITEAGTERPVKGKKYTSKTSVGYMMPGEDYVYAGTRTTTWRNKKISAYKLNHVREKDSDVYIPKHMIVFSGSEIHSAQNEDWPHDALTVDASKLTTNRSRNSMLALKNLCRRAYGTLDSHNATGLADNVKQYDINVYDTFHEAKNCLRSIVTGDISESVNESAYDDMKNSVVEHWPKEIKSEEFLRATVLMMRDAAIADDDVKFWCDLLSEALDDAYQRGVDAGSNPY